LQIKLIKKLLKTCAAFEDSVAQYCTPLH